MTISLGISAQATDIELYQRLEKAVNLPLIAKSAPPNQGYEARLYIKHDDPVYIIEILSESGAKHFFTFESKTLEAKSIDGVKRKSNNQLIIFKGGYYLFVCSYGFHVVD
jgi:hypothetical protein